jgi:hypothetical protein
LTADLERGTVDTGLLDTERRDKTTIIGKTTARQIGITVRFREAGSSARVGGGGSRVAVGVCDPAKGR